MEELENLTLKRLDSWYAKQIKAYDDGQLLFDFTDDPNGEFYAKVDFHERYIEARNKILARQPVKTKDIVADTDAVETTLKTYHAINTKIQNNITKGVELSTNDIKLLVEMMKALNGEK